MTLTDNKLGSITCPDVSLAPGGSETCTTTYLTTQTDLDNGQIENTATVTGASRRPAARFRTTPRYCAGRPESRYRAGQSPRRSQLPPTRRHPDHLQLPATNTGNVTLRPRRRHRPHDRPRRASTATGHQPGPGHTHTCTATYTTTQADLDGTGITNTGTATGAAPKGSQLTDTDTATVTPGPEAGSSPWSRRPTHRTSRPPAPGSPTSYEVTNTGNVTLTRSA